MEKQDQSRKKPLNFDYKNIYPIKKYLSEKGKIIFLINCINNGIQIIEL